jgi:hypothetical protein
MLNKFKFKSEVMDVLNNCKGVTIPETRSQLVDLALGGVDEFTVEYEVNGKMRKEAVITRCKNGAVINYVDTYMRRRDPDCLIVGDDKPTDKPRYSEQFGKDFNELRTDTFEWLKKQELIVVPDRKSVV